MNALGDPHSWITSKQTVVSKIAYLHELGRSQYQDVTRQLAGQPVPGGDPFAAPAAPTPATGDKTYASTKVDPATGHRIGANPGDTHWTDLQTGQPVQ